MKFYKIVKICNDRLEYFETMPYLNSPYYAADEKHAYLFDFDTAERFLVWLKKHHEKENPTLSIVETSYERQLCPPFNPF